MRTIQKFRCEPPAGQRQFSIHQGAQFFAVGLDGQGFVCAWAIVDDERPKIQRTLYLATTGAALPLFVARAMHVGSATAKNGDVVHIFDIGEGALRVSKEPEPLTSAAAGDGA